MNFPLVSVIVPVYGVEDYILDCLNSLYAQTYSNYEVILIDDGSPDNSAKIIEEYIQQTDKKVFRLIRKENGGVSSARNRGISEAKGEWITFVDSDDFVEPEYISYMIDGLQKYPADYCSCGFKRCIDGNVLSEPVDLSNIRYGLRSEMLASISPAYPWGKLFLSKIVTENNIKFDVSTKVCEDRSFNFLYFCHVKKCLILPNRNYIYRKRPGSAVYNSAHPEKKKNLWRPVEKFWRSFENEDEIKDAFIKSHHLSHNILDSIFAELINSVLDYNDVHFIKVVTDPISKFCFKNYKHKTARTKEKFLCYLLKNKFLKLFKFVVKLYYNKNASKSFYFLVNIGKRRCM